MSRAYESRRGEMLVDWAIHDATLIRMWYAGNEVAEIIKAIPRATRFAINRRRVRLKLPARNAPPIVLTPERLAARALAVKLTNTRNPKSGAAAVDAARVASTLGKAHRKAAPPPVPAYKPPATPAPTRCQWPLTDKRPWLFCEVGVARGSYCAKHGATAYTPPSEWAKRTYGA